MERQPRNEDWDEYELSDFNIPSFEITPENISSSPGWGVEIPTSAQEVDDVLRNWITDCLYFTQESGKEHGIQVDGYGNVFGIHGLSGVRNTESSLTLDADHIGNVGLTFHTHPVQQFQGAGFLPSVFSPTDIEDSFAIRLEEPNEGVQPITGPANIGLTNASVNPDNEKYAIITLSPVSNPSPKYIPTEDRFEQVAIDVTTELAEGTNLLGLVKDTNLHGTDTDNVIQSHASFVDNMDRDFELTYKIVDEGPLAEL